MSPLKRFLTPNSTVKATIVKTLLEVAPIVSIISIASIASIASIVPIVFLKHRIFLHHSDASDLKQKYHLSEWIRPRAISRARA
jgi:hypothetical protein